MTAQDAERERAIEDTLREYAMRTDVHRIDHTVQVTSFGGAGTTALCKYLLEARVDLQPGPAQWPFKHRRVPPTREEVPEDFRAVYIVSDPRDSLLSIFRRGYQIGRYRSLHDREPPAEVVQRLASLERFLAAGVDDFELADHVNRWRNHPPGYPVLFVRYELLGECWEQLRDFVDVPSELPPLRVRGRSSDWRSLESPQREQIDSLYGDLARYIEGLPAAEVV